MASIAEMIMNLAGHQTPEQLLVDHMATARGGDHTQSGAVGAGGTAVADSQQLPSVGYSSQQDMIQLYSNMIQQQNRQNSINRGIGLIGSAFAQPGNRDRIMQSFGGPGLFSGGGTSGQAGGMFQMLMDFENQRRSFALDQRGRARVPGIAERFGIDPETAMHLYETGGLDEFIREASKENVQLVDYGDGTFGLIDKKGGKETAKFGSPKARKVEWRENADGSKTLVYEDTKQPVQEPGENFIEAPAPSTSMIEEYEWEKDAWVKQGGNPTDFPTPTEYRRNRDDAEGGGAGRIDQLGRKHDDPPTDMQYITDDFGIIQINPQTKRPLLRVVPDSALAVRTQAGQQDIIEEQRRILEADRKRADELAREAQRVSEADRAFNRGVLESDRDHNLDVNADRRAQAAEERDAAEYEAEQQKLKDAALNKEIHDSVNSWVVGDASNITLARIEEHINSGNPVPINGIGALIGMIPLGVAQNDVRSNIGVITSFINRDELQNMRENNPNGSSGLGQVTQTEHVMLQRSKGALEQANSLQSIVYGLVTIPLLTEAISSGAFVDPANPGVVDPVRREKVLSEIRRRGNREAMRLTGKTVSPEDDVVGGDVVDDSEIDSDIMDLLRGQ